MNRARLCYVRAAAGVVGAACALAGCSAPRSTDARATSASRPEQSASSKQSAPPARDASTEATRLLPIPARKQAAGAPKEGWCGETAIQEALLYVGAWAPQRTINQAGHPVHPDLYSSDIPVALTELGVRYALFSARTKGYDAFVRWAREAIDAGDPVLAGVKILPTAHPEWDVDHFVLAVGYGAKGVLVNTTWGTREWVADTRTPGLSLDKAVYGIRISGLTLPAGARAAHLSVVEEDNDTVALRATCSDLDAGRSYRLEMRDARGEPKPAWSEEVPASESTVSRVVRVDGRRAVRFRCVRAD